MFQGLMPLLTWCCCRLPDRVKSHDVDFDNPSSHGDFLVALSANEKVCQKKKVVTSIAIARPNTHPGEIECLKAVASKDKITIASLHHKPSFLENEDKWVKVLTDDAECFDATELVATMNALVTSMKKANKPKPELKMTTLSLKQAGITLSKKHFANDNWELDMVPMLCDCISQLAGKDFWCGESMVIWRACITGAETDVLEETGAKVADLNLDMLAKLMKGTKIS